MPHAQASLIALQAPKPKTRSEQLVEMWVIDPQKGGWAQYWDLFTTVALIYTAIITPYEVAFLLPPTPSERLDDHIYITNRAVDIVFILDMCMQFRTAFRRVDPKEGIVWITTPRAIAINYVCSYWFYLDLLSILTSLFDIVGDESSQNLIALRVLRVMRLIKLVRLVRGSRIFKKWEMSVSINYSYLAVFQIVFGILIGSHWYACIWGLQASFDPLKSWPRQKNYCVAWESDNRTFVEASVAACLRGQMCSKGECSGDVCEGGYECVEPFVMYAYALYFSVMTITSVGYGDVLAEPFNVSEQFVCCFIMMTSGALWGYLIGTFCSLASQMTPQEAQFKEELSSLNTFMAENHIPREAQFRLREYLFQGKKLNDLEVRKRLIAKLSPSMQLQVSWQMNAHWVHMVWYLSESSGVPEKLVMDLAMVLKAHVFPPRELCPPGYMYIVQSGCAYWGGRMKRYGDVWGEDVVLMEEDLQLDLPALGTTYLSVFTIDAPALLGSIGNHPDFMARFRILKIRWTVRRAFVREAEIKVYSAGGRFRNRYRPIYAKELAKQIDRQLREREDALVVPKRPPRESKEVPPVESKKVPPVEGKGRGTKGAKKGRKEDATTAHQKKQVEAASLDGGMELRMKQMKQEVADSDARFDAVESRLDALSRLLMQTVSSDSTAPPNLAIPKGPLAIPSRPVTPVVPRLASPPIQSARWAAKGSGDLLDLEA